MTAIEDNLGLGPGMLRRLNGSATLTWAREGRKRHARPNASKRYVQEGHEVHGQADDKGEGVRVTEKTRRREGVHSQRAERYSSQMLIRPLTEGAEPRALPLTKGPAIRSPLTLAGRGPQS